MNDVTWSALLSTAGGALAIAIGVMFPAIAMRLKKGHSVKSA